MPPGLGFRVWGLKLRVYTGLLMMNEERWKSQCGMPYDSLPANPAIISQEDAACNQAGVAGLRLLAISSAYRAVVATTCTLLAALMFLL